MMDYYDYILGLIPVTMGGIAALFAAVGFGASMAVPAGALAALPLVAHALFVRAPVAEDPEPTTTTQRQTGHTNTAD